MLRPEQTSASCPSRKGTGAGRISRGRIPDPPLSALYEGSSLGQLATQRGGTMTLLNLVLFLIAMVVIALDAWYYMTSHRSKTAAQWMNQIEGYVRPSDPSQSRI